MLIVDIKFSKQNNICLQNSMNEELQNKWLPIQRWNFDLKKRKKTFITDSFNKQSTPVVYNSTKFFYNNVDKDIECPIFFLAPNPPPQKKATRHQNFVPESPSWKIQTNLVYIVKNIEIKGIGSPLANIIILPSFPRKTVLDPCLAMDVLVLCG